MRCFYIKYCVDKIIVPMAIPMAQNKCGWGLNSLPGFTTDFNADKKIK